MKKVFHTHRNYLVFALAAVLLGSCTKNYTDPNEPTDVQVFSSVNGLTGIATDLQALYSGDGGSIYGSVASSGLLTNELAVVNAGNTNEQEFYVGGDAIENTNGLVTNLWTTSNKIISDANDIATHIGIVKDPGYASGLLAYSDIFKAMAIADLATFWDHVPDTIGAQVTFITNADGFKKAVSVLNAALATIGTTPVSSGFLANVPAGIDIPNTLYALKARYSLFAGDYAGALAAANNVDLTVKSVFSFSSVNLNPIFSAATSTNNLFQPQDSTLGLPVSLKPDPNDQRVPFYIVQLANSSTGLGIRGFFSATTQPISVYLPGEIMLIKAECLAQTDVNGALTQLNLVVTKTPAADPFGVGAALPAIAGPLTQADLLTQIYRNRSIELYMAGLQLEDQRRLGRPATERKRNYLPYPFAERNDNSNTPADPTF